MGETHLKVLALDPSGCEKNSSCFDKKIFSKTGEGLVWITDAHPCTVEIIDLTSSSDDHTEREDAGRSLGWRKQVPGCHAKARKMASMSSPSTKSGHCISTMHFLITFSNTCGYAILII